jgi:hypothetical protein
VRPETINLPQKSSDTKSNGQNTPMECLAGRKSGEKLRFFYISKIQNPSIARCSGGGRKGGSLDKWGFVGRMPVMSKKNIAFATLFLFMALIFAAPLAEAVLSSTTASSHHSNTSCPMPTPANQAPANGHSGFTSCCGVSFMNFGVDSNPFAMFFASTLIFFSYTLFIPSRITAELFRPPKN